MRRRRASAPPPDATPAGVLLAAVVGAAVASVLALLAYHLQPHGLTPPINVVGGPTFCDFDFKPPFRTYRLIVWGWPVVFSISFWLCRRWWGLGRSVSAPSGQDDARDAEARADVPPAVIARPGGLLRLLVPAVLIAVTVSSLSGAPRAHVSPLGLLCGAGYVVLVLGSAWLSPRVWRRAPAALGDRVATANAVAAVITAVVGVFLFSLRTRAVTDSGAGQAWPFLPWWVAVPLVALLLGVLFLRRRGAPALLEWHAVTGVAGAALVFVLTAAIAPPVHDFVGFDDAQSLLGADLLTRGLMPWRDFIFIHGLFDDALRSLVAFGLFGHTIWGVAAGLTLIWIPLCWVGLYWLACWAAVRRGAVLLLTTVVLLLLQHAWALYETDYVRWVGAPYILLLLGATLDRPTAGRSRAWTASLALVVFAYGVLVPESVYLAAAVFSVLALSDVVGRPDGRRWFAFPRLRIFVVVGVVSTVLWTVYLLATHSLGPFVSYYRTFAPDHAATGAFKVVYGSEAGYSNAFWSSAALIALVLTVLVVRILLGLALTSRHWVLLAAGIFAGLYGEKALGRFDQAHMVEAMLAAVPLYVVTLSLVLSRIDDLLTEFGAEERPRVMERAVAGRQAVAVVVVAVLLATTVTPWSLVWHAPGAHAVRVPTLRTAARVGYQAQGGVDTPLERALGRTITELGGDAPVFDFSNSPGYVYFLLQHAPASAFTNVSMAVTEFAQQQVISDLKDSSPPVVVYDTDAIGLPSWDGVSNPIRHFELSQYLLDHWTPVVSTHGELVMLRNDLVPDRPSLSDIPQAVTTDLYFRSLPCDWGYAANFLPSAPTGSSLTLHFSPSLDSRSITAQGWAYDAADHRAPRVLLAAHDRVIAQTDPQGVRADVAKALKDHRARSSGWSFSLTTPATGALSTYAVLSDGRAHPVGGAVGAPTDARLTLPGGRTIAISPDPATGHVDGVVVTASRVSTTRVPAGVDLADYELAQFRSDGTMGEAAVQVSDDPSFADQHVVAFESLPVSGDDVPVRVGSCLQWHGYDGRTLYLRQRGGDPVTEMELSGVR